MNEGNEALSRLALLAILALAFLVFLGKSYETTLQAMDSSVHARLALEATANGLIPKLPIAIADPTSARWPGGFDDHPFTLFYLNGWVMRLLGPSAWSARLLPGLFSVGCIYLTYLLGLSFGSVAYALAAAGILALTPEFILYGARFHLDTALTFFILLSFLAWIRNRSLSAGISAGLAVITKTPVGLLVLPSAFLVALEQRSFIKARNAALAGVIALLVVAAFWWGVSMISSSSVAMTYWHAQVWGTAVGGRGFGGGPDYWSFFGILKSKYWPWLPLLAWGTYLVARRWKTQPEQLKLVCIATLILVFVVSSLKFRFLHYFLPAYPFCALISAWPIARWLEKHALKFYCTLIAVSLVSLTALAVAPIALAPEMFPALKRFNAIIQSYGDCSDPVLMVRGNQPYGSEADYQAEIAFYTSRGVHAIDCTDAENTLQQKLYPWVIVSGENIDKCLSPDLKKRFSRIFKYGNQYLLASQIPNTESIDLTPLDRELKAVRDCAPAPYTLNSYHAYE